MFVELMCDPCCTPVPSRCCLSPSKLSSLPRSHRRGCGASVGKKWLILPLRISNINLELNEIRVMSTYVVAIGAVYIRGSPSHAVC